MTSDPNPYDGQSDEELSSHLAGLMAPQGWEGHIAFTPWMWTTLGLFHATWAAVENQTDFAIGRFLNISHEEAHLITSGMMFGRKARLLSDLIRRSDHPKKSDLKRAFSVIQGASRRDMIAHSYILAEEDGRIAFLERPMGGGFVAKKHYFTRADFTKHVQDLWNAQQEFAHALGVSNEDLSAFSEAAVMASSKPSTSSGHSARE